MNAFALKELVIGGKVAVEFGKEVYELEAYVEPKMRAHVIGVTIQPDDVAIIKLDYTAFEDFNKAFEESNYYDKLGNPTLTAREAGKYDVLDDIYVSAIADLEGTLTLIDSSRVELLAEFQASGEKSYLQWLESIVMASRAK